MSILLDIGQRRIQNCIKKVKAETFIKAFDHLNDKIHYAAVIMKWIFVDRMKWIFIDRIIELMKLSDEIHSIFDLAYENFESKIFPFLRKIVSSKFS